MFSLPSPFSWILAFESSQKINCFMKERAQKLFSKKQPFQLTLVNRRNGGSFRHFIRGKDDIFMSKIFES
jgi:hypothetical protein